jgi:CubicO group peptidase (beta-lactamase class C family)
VRYDFWAVEAYIERLVADMPLNGAGLFVAHRDEVIYQRAFGAYALDMSVGIASASKWIAGAVIASLIGDGTLHLDERASDYLMGFGGSKTNITLRQLLAHTSGLPHGESPCARRALPSLAMCADEIANHPLAAQPGSVFAYGEGAFQVAGRIAEVATGQPWQELFCERLAAPLRMRMSDYGDAGGRALRIGSGMRSTLSDYSNFVRMIASGGMFGGVRILAPEVVALMHEDHTFGAPVLYSPNLFPGPGYGLGVWRDSADGQGRAVQVSSPGASGFTPWVDFRRGLACVFLVRDSYQRMAKPVRALQGLVREVVDAGEHT